MESCTLALWMHTNEHEFVLGWGPIQSLQESKTCWESIRETSGGSSYSLTLRKPCGAVDSKNIDMAAASVLIESWGAIKEEEQDLDLHW